MTQEKLLPVPPKGSPIDAWNRFWFTPRSPLTLGFIRIFAGFVLFYVHLVYTFDLHNLFGRHGWVNIETVNAIRYDYRPGLLPTGWDALTAEETRELTPVGLPVFSIFFHVTDPVTLVVIHAFILFVMLLFMIGFCTRITSVIVWIGAVSYIQRTPTTLFGIDTMTNILMLYLMIGPSGSALSVDRLIARWWARRKGRELGPPQPSIMANISIRLLQVHFCIVYFVSGMSKLQGGSWWSGTAMWGTMANFSFAPMYSTLYVDFLRMVARERWIWELLMIGGAYCTLALEISFAFMIWRPRWRWLMICFSIALHTGIAIIMGLAGFSMAMLCFVACFIPTEAVQGFVESVQTKLPALKTLSPPPAETLEEAVMAK